MERGLSNKLEDYMNRVAITSLGVLSPIGLNLEENEERLFSGESGIIPLEVNPPNTYKPMAGLIDLEKAVSTLSLITEKEKANLSPIALFALKAAYEALTQGGFLKNDYYDYPTTRCGSILGVGMPDMKMIRDGAIGWEKRGTRGVPVRTIPGSIPNVSTSLLAQKFNLRGITFTTSSACASSSHAIMSAYMEIAFGHHDLMLTGGSFSSICPFGLSCFHTTGALYKGDRAPTEASRPFDLDRRGFVMGEGAAIFVLEDYKRALERKATIIGEIVGFGATSDGYHITSPDPEGTFQAVAMQKALSMAGVDPKEVIHLNAHATSTKIGDVAEINAIKKAFGSAAKDLIISANKSSIGHTMNSAGAIELAFSLLALKRQASSPTINLEDQDPACDLNCSANQSVPFKSEYALSNSFGFGGTNTSILIRSPRNV